MLHPVFENQADLEIGWVLQLERTVGKMALARVACQGQPLAVMCILALYYTRFASSWSVAAHSRQAAVLQARA